MTQSASARVYAVSSLRNGLRVFTGYGCLFSSRHVYKLSDLPRNSLTRSSLIRPKLAGRYVAFTSSLDFSTQLVVKDLKTGRDRTSIDRGVTEVPYTAEAFVLNNAGALAFLGKSSTAGQQLELATSGLQARVLDQGSGQGTGTGTEPSIAAASLGTNIGGTALYWTNAGQLRTALFK